MPRPIGAPGSARTAISPGISATSRGCPYSCNWCAKPTFGRRYSQRSPANVAEEMRRLKAEIAPDHIWFADDIFGMTAQWIAHFADERRSQRDAHIPFMLQSRANLIDPARRRSAARSGRRGGLARRGIRLAANPRCHGQGHARRRCARTRRARSSATASAVGWFLQLGYPSEQWEDIVATRDLVRDEAPDEIGVSVAYPLARHDLPRTRRRRARRAPQLARHRRAGDAVPGDLRHRLLSDGPRRAACRGVGTDASITRPGRSRASRRAHTDRPSRSVSRCRADRDADARAAFRGARHSMRSPTRSTRGSMPWMSVAAQRRAVRQRWLATFPPDRGCSRSAAAPASTPPGWSTRAAQVLLTDASPAMVRSRGAEARRRVRAEVMRGRASRAARCAGRDASTAPFPISPRSIASPTSRRSRAGWRGWFGPAVDVLLVMFGCFAPARWSSEAARGRFAICSAGCARATCRRAWRSRLHRALSSARATWSTRWRRGSALDGHAARSACSSRPARPSRGSRAIRACSSRSKLIDRLAARPLAALGDHVLYRFVRVEDARMTAAFAEAAGAVSHAHMPRTARSRGRGHAGAELLRLPYLASGPLARQWAVRARTFDAFVRTVRAAGWRGRPSISLDLGAGNGWLSYRLAIEGHRCRAIDIRDDSDRRPRRGRPAPRSARTSTALSRRSTMCRFADRSARSRRVQRLAPLCD